MKIPTDIQQRIIYRRTTSGELAAIPELYKLEPNGNPCERCGKTLDDTRVVVHEWAPTQAAWMNNCRGCLKYENPLTGEYNLTRGQWRAIFKQDEINEDK